MKNSALLVGLCLLCALPLRAADLDKTCMGALPEQIEISGIKKPLVKMSDRLVDYETKQKGLGYSNGYKNGLCIMTVYLYDLNQKKIDEAVLEKDFADSVQNIRNVFDRGYKKQLSPFGGYELPVMGTKYLGHVAFSDNTTEVVLQGVFQNRLLKGRVTCGQVEGFDKDTNAAIALGHADNALDAIAQNLDNCLKKK